jgi:hypothetical protein
VEIMARAVARWQGGGGHWWRCSGIKLGCKALLVGKSPFYCGNGGVVVVVCCVGGIAVSLLGDGATMSGDGGFQPKARPRFWIGTTMMMFLGRNISLGALLRHRHLLVGSAW